MKIKLVSDATPYYDDLDRITRCSAEAFIPYEGFQDEDAHGGVAPDFFSNYRHDHEEVLLVETEKDGIVAFLCLDIDCTRDDVPAKRPFTFLSLMIVDKPHRNNGIGTLLNHVTLGLRDIGYINSKLVLSTWSGNERQRHVCEKQGFEIAYRKNNHRVNGGDTVYFVLYPETESESPFRKSQILSLTESGTHLKLIIIRNEIIRKMIYRIVVVQADSLML